MMRIIQQGQFGRRRIGGAVLAEAHRWWRIRTVSSESDQAYWAETQFLDSAVATSQPGTGSVVSGSANWFDGNLSNFQGGALVGTTCGYAFDAPQAITHVKIWARNDGFPFQCPRVFWLDYSDNGSTWTAYKYIYRSGYATNGQSFLFTLADWGGSDDLSALDESGGYRYYRFLWDGTDFAGGSGVAYQINLVLKKSGSYLQPSYHRCDSGTACASMQSITALDGGYFAWGFNTSLIVDFGYKRVIDQTGIRHRSFADGIQGAKSWKLYAGNSTFDVSGTSTLLASINDTGPNPPGPYAERLFSV